MRDPTFVGVPLFSWRDGEAIKLSLRIRELDAITGLEIPLFRHMRILGESNPTVGTSLYRLGDGTVTPLP